MLDRRSMGFKVDLSMDAFKDTRCDITQVAAPSGRLNLFQFSGSSKKKQLKGEAARKAPFRLIFS